MERLPFSRFLIACLLVSVACQQVPGTSSPGHGGFSDGGDEGAALFREYCAVCHGDRGYGDGPSSPFLAPAPRDFTSGRFHWVSTENAVPSREDLERTIARGVPGSAMPAWSWLGEKNLGVLADHVLHLAREGQAEGRADRSVPEGLVAGRKLPPVAMPEVTPELLARGERVFAGACAACHGADGKGERTPRWNPDGTPNWARDFTAGYLGGGAGLQDLANRVRLGIPGTAMAPTDLPDRDLAALLAHVQDLIPSGTEERLVHRRRRLDVPRVADVPRSFDDATWKKAPRIEIVLAPLRWREDAVRQVELAALHDGTSIAIRARWADPSRDAGLFTDVHRPDAVALQLSKAARPPLFGMGSPASPTSIWHWQSVRLEEVAGALDLVKPSPHLQTDSALGEVRTDAPIYHRLEGVSPLSEQVESFEPRGVKSVRGSHRAKSEDVLVSAGHDGQGWAVVFARELAGAPSDRLDLRAGDLLQIACAVWDGARGDSGAEKSISIWQELRLLP